MQQSLLSLLCLLPITWSLGLAHEARTNGEKSQTINIYSTLARRSPETAIPIYILYCISRQRSLTRALHCSPFRLFATFLHQQRDLPSRRRRLCRISVRSSNFLHFRSNAIICAASLAAIAIGNFLADGAQCCIAAYALYIALVRGNDNIARDLCLEVRCGMPRGYFFTLRAYKIAK